MVERNMCNAAMRGIVVPPGSRATSRANGSRRNLGALVSDHRPCADLVRIGTRFVVPISDPPPLAMTNVASMKAFFFVQCASIAKLVGNIR
jgi:hypothetical protein